MISQHQPGGNLRIASGTRAEECFRRGPVTDDRRGWRSESEFTAGGVHHGLGRANVSLDEAGEPFDAGLGGDAVQGEAGDGGAGRVPGAQ